jgi:uncharacterized protein (TIGR03437 family)
VIRLFIAGLTSAALCLAQQTISVVNAASQSGGVAPGSILSIRQLKPPQIIGPVDPNHVSVQVRPSGSAVSLDAPLLPVPLLSIWAQLPASTPLGAADITLTIDGQASAPARIMVTRTNFGLFTQAGNGLGSANAQNQDATVTKLTNPALPGQYSLGHGPGLSDLQRSDHSVGWSRDRTRLRRTCSGVARGRSDRLPGSRYRHAGWLLCFGRREDRRHCE